MNPPLQQASISPPASVLERVYENARCARLTIQVLTHALETASPSQMTFLDSYLQAEADSRKRSSIRRLTAQAHLPTHKTLTGYDWNRVTLPEGVTPQTLESLDFLNRQEDLICYGDVGCGKTHLATALVRQACQRGIKARFTTAHDLVMTLRKAKNEGRLDKELQAHAKFQLLAIDELGYLPIDPDGARLLYQVIANSYEKSSLIITTNIEFSRWGNIFGDDNIAAAIIDRLIHHGRLLRHKGDSWRVTHALLK